MKTKPMAHQKVGCKRLAASPVFAMGAEQGTGKTWMLLKDVEDRWKKGEVTALLVITLNGVHINWVRKEIPQHLSAQCNSTFWISGAPKKHLKLLTKQLAEMDKPVQEKLQIHAMNIDAVNTKAGFAYAQAFLAASRAKTAFIIDESQCIKNPNAKRTKQVMKLGANVNVKRISSGTLVANSPLDLFSQYSFLQEGILKTSSYRAFVAEYAVLLPQSSELIQAVMRRTGARGAPQILAKDRDGKPRFKNIDKLTRIIEPFTYRITKDECLDLPAKIYENHYFDLLPAQRAAYEQVVKERNWFREDGEIDTFTALTVITKLRQITSGFILVNGEPTKLANAKPRMDALMDAIECSTGQIIIWASFQEEIKQIAALLGEEARTYYGATKRADRTKAIEDFQSGAARFFIGNPSAAGTGITLTAARTAIYYSSSFSLIDRKQSEDRSHRIGTRHPVVYIDLVARDTIDERIAASLQAKELVAAAIMDGIR